MKKLFALVLSLAFAQLSYAQSPQKMSYQSVIRNASGELVTESPVGIQISIIQGSPTGTVVYEEAHTPTTNINGLASIEIGTGIPVLGTLDAVNWGNGPYYIKSETDPEGGSNYVLSGTSEMLSVPYALYAASTGSDGGWEIIADTLTTDKWVGIGTALPAAPLHILGDNIATSLQIEATGSISTPPPFPTSDAYPATIKFKNVDGEYSIGTNKDGYLTFYDHSEDLTSLIARGGKVGIGHSPSDFSAKFTVDGSMKIKNSLSALDNGGLNFKTNDGQIRLNILDQGDISISNRLGIGTTTPQSTLHIVAESGVLPGILFDGGSEDIAVSDGGALQIGQWDGSSFNEVIVVNSAGGVDITPGIENVTIDGTASGGVSNSAFSYPLYIKGSSQGIAIRLNETEAEDGNNYMYFRDNGGTRGSIGAQNPSDLSSSFEFIWYNTMGTLNTAWAIAEGIACGAQIDLAEVAVMAASGATAVAEWVEWTVNMQSSVGVIFESGSADYAEWLERDFGVEDLAPGTVVGVIGGKVSLNTSNASQIMVVSTAPLVLGNTPPKGKESAYEKIAFMGQVPVKVNGRVNEGDFILSSGKNNGMAIAKSRKNMNLDDYDKVVGVAWSSSQMESGSTFINTAIGLSTNDLVESLKEQRQDIDDLRTSISEISNYLKKLDPNFELSVPLHDLSNQNIPIATTATISKETTQDFPENLDFKSLERLMVDNQDFLLEVLSQAKSICVRKGMDVSDPMVAQHFQADYFMERLRASNEPNEKKLEKVTPKE